MASDNQASMPQSQAGLIRYFDEDDGGGFRLDPKLVVAGICTLIVLEILFQYVMGSAMGV